MCGLTRFVSDMQVSHRIFELTNTLKMTFVPSRDNKRLSYNFLAGIAISVILYSVSFVLVNVPKMLVRIYIQIPFQHKKKLRLDLSC